MLGTTVSIDTCPRQLIHTYRFQGETSKNSLKTQPPFSATAEPAYPNSASSMNYCFVVRCMAG